MARTASAMKPGCTASEDPMALSEGLILRSEPGEDRENRASARHLRPSDAEGLHLHLDCRSVDASHAQAGFATSTNAKHPARLAPLRAEPRSGAAGPPRCHPHLGHNEERSQSGGGYSLGVHRGQKRTPRPGPLLRPRSARAPRPEPHCASAAGRSPAPARRLFGPTWPRRAACPSASEPAKLYGGPLRCHADTGRTSPRRIPIAARRL